MSLRSFQVGLGILAGIFVLFAIAIGLTFIRGEDTRNIIEKSPCTAAPASAECQRIGREAARERSLEDSCIPFAKVLTTEAYRTYTRCPRREVVPQNSPTASQQPAPSGGPDSSTPAPGPSRPAPDPVEPSPVTPAPADPEPEPTEPDPEVPADKPLIDLEPVIKPVCDLTRPLAALC